METVREIGRRVAENASILLLTNVLGKCTQAVFAIYAARTLGVERFGTYTLVVTFIFFLDFLGGAVIRPMALREIARNRDQVERLLSNILILLLGGAVLAYILLLLGMPLLHYQPETKTLIYLLALTLFPNAFSLAFSTASYSFEHMKLPSVISITSGFFSSFLGILALYFGYSLKVLIGIIVVVRVGEAVIAGWFIRKNFLRSGLKIDPLLWRTLIKQSLPFAILGILRIIHARIDIFMLSIMKGPLEGSRAIGYYTPAYSILSTFMMLPANLRMAMVPALASRQDSTHVIRSILEGATKVLLCCLSFPIIIITNFFAEDVIALVFGEAYLPTADALRILGWAYALDAATAPTFALLSMAKRLEQYIPWALGITSLNIFLNLLIIPSYSFIGASVATLISMTTSWFLRLYLLRRIVNIEFTDTRILLNLLVPMGITFSVIFFIYSFSSIHPLFLASLAIALYLATLATSKVFTKQELSLLKSALRQLFSPGHIEP